MIRARVRYSRGIGLRLFHVAGKLAIRPPKPSCNVRSSSLVQSPRRLADGGPGLRTHTEKSLLPKNFSHVNASVRGRGTAALRPPRPSSRDSFCCYTVVTRNE